MLQSGAVDGQAKGHEFHTVVLGPFSGGLGIKPTLQPWTHRLNLQRVAFTRQPSTPLQAKQTLSLDLVEQLGFEATTLHIPLPTHHGRLHRHMAVVVVVVIVFATWGLLRESLDMVFDVVPPDIDPRAVRVFFEQLPGVFDVHDLHIWPMSTTETALTVHLVIPDGRLDDRLLYRINVELRDRFRIGHATVQIERGNVPGLCDQEEQHFVGELYR